MVEPLSGIGFRKIGAGTIIQDIYYLIKEALCL